MKQVSSKMFFTVMWRGVCQALGWFFGLFGYKRDGKFAHCVWGLFAVSATVVVTIIAGVLIYGLGHEYYERHRQAFCDGEDCYYNRYISREVYLHDHGDGKAEVINRRTGEKTLTGVAWISRPLGEKDSLVVFSNGKKRGYFNMYTGEVVIPAKYTRAWVFSDGIASVEENGVIKFIDGNDKQVFDRTFYFDHGNDGYVFHGGYCIIDSDNNNKYGLMNTKGVTVIPEEYDEITASCKLDYWALSKGTEAEVLDKDLKPVLQLTDCSSIWIIDDFIDVTMTDNTMRRYDFQGGLIDGFYISGLEPLEYETEETYQTKETYTDDDGIEHECLSEPQHKTARARLFMYSAGNSMKGLMTADGHVVTMPKYEDISAFANDAYLCTVSCGDMVVVNGSGQEVK